MNLGITGLDHDLPLSWSQSLAQNNIDSVARLDE